MLVARRRPMRHGARRMAAAALPPSEMTPSVAPARLAMTAAGAHVHRPDDAGPARRATHALLSPLSNAAAVMRWRSRTSAVRTVSMTFAGSLWSVPSTMAARMPARSATHSLGAETIAGHRNGGFRRAQMRNLGAGARRLAHAVREDGHVPPQIRTDEQQRLKLLHLCDRHAERGERRIGILVAEVPLTQTMIDVVGAQAARDAVQQVELFERARAVGQHAQAAPARRLGRNRFERPAPIRGRAAFAHFQARRGGPHCRRLRS